jgi:hypothetical protein
MLELASKNKERGILPQSPEDMAYKTGYPKEIFELAISVLSRPDINWIENGEIKAESTNLPQSPAIRQNTSPELNGIELNRIEKKSKEEGSYKPLTSPLQGDKDRDKEEIKTWRNDIDIYIASAREEVLALLQNAEWLKERKTYHSRLDIRLTVQKAMNDFWLTEAGWKHKKKSKTKELDWESTINNALTLKGNQVYEKIPFTR